MRLFTLFELENKFGGTCDLLRRPLRLGGRAENAAALIYIDSLVSSEAAGRLIIDPLGDPMRTLGDYSPEAVMASLCGLNAEVCSDVDGAADKLLSGFALVYLPSFGAAVAAELRSPDKRAVAEPKDEKVLKGSREAFTECLQTNCALLRRRLKTSDLRLRAIFVGSRAECALVVAWIDGFTPEKLVDEMVKRVENLRVEGVITSSVLEECLADSPLSPLPQLIVTERADKFCLNLLEGRVGLLADTLPLGYLAPASLPQLMKAPEDEAAHFAATSLMTLFRYFALLLSLTLPAIYLALALYHQSLIPLRILQSMIEAELEVPFPTAAEVFIMLIAVDLLEEAGLRMPGPIGPTVSIIGALIIGQSAVEAKIVSPIIVVTVALASTAQYALPNRDLQLAVKLGRLGLVALSAFFGLYGLGAGLAFIAAHLIMLKSFGKSYISPLARYPARALLRLPMTVKRKEDPTV